MSMGDYLFLYEGFLVVDLSSQQRACQAIASNLPGTSNPPTSLYSALTAMLPNPSSFTASKSDDYLIYRFSGCGALRDHLETCLTALASFCDFRIEGMAHDGAVWLYLGSGGSYYDLPGKVIYPREEEFTAPDSPLNRIWE